MTTIVGCGRLKRKKKKPRPGDPPSGPGFFGCPDVPSAFFFPCARSLSLNPPTKVQMLDEMNKFEQKRTRMNKLLNEKETASYLGISRTTLAQSRMAKTKAKLPAPPFIRLGRTIRYVKEDLDKWIERHKVAHVKPKRLQKPVSVLGKKFELSVTRKARRAPKVRQQQLPYLNG